MSKLLPRSVLAAVASLLIGACGTWGLRHAVKNSDLAGTKKRFESDPTLSPESPDECGWTLLHYATYYQYTPLAEYLLGRGANVNARTTAFSGRCNVYSHIPSRSTPLTIAAYYGQADIILVLLAHGADYTAKDTAGYDALAYARKFDFGRATKALEEAAAKAR